LQQINTLKKQNNKKQTTKKKFRPVNITITVLLITWICG
jgi:hypothetical protein